MTQNRKPILIILAGGKSTRMGTPKGLLQYKSNYWVLEQVAAFKTGNMIMIGLGYDYQLYFDAIPWLRNAAKKPQSYKGKNVQVVINLMPKFGLFSTLQAVLKTLYSKKLDGNQTNKDVLVLPIDVPLFDEISLKKFTAKENTVVIPNSLQKNGHPTKLAPKFWKQLLTIAVDSSEARLDVQIKKLPSESVSIINIVDENCIKNLNTPKSWEHFTSQYPKD